MTTAPFEITRDEVMELAARKLVDAYADDSDLSEQATQMIRERIKEAFEKRLNARIDEFLSVEMEKILNQQICPTDIWGEKVGKPTTIRDQLAERAKIFWDVKVDSDGRAETWGGLPRHEVLFKKICQDQFSQAIKENADVIAAEFKAALKTDVAKIAADHIDKLITTRNKR